MAACAVRRTWLPVPLQRQALVRRRAGLDEQALGIPALPAVVDGARVIGGLRIAELDVPQVPGVRSPSVAQACLIPLLFSACAVLQLLCLVDRWRSKCKAAGCKLSSEQKSSCPTCLCRTLCNAQPARIDT